MRMGVCFKNLLEKWRTGGEDHFMSFHLEMFQIVLLVVLTFYLVAFAGKCYI